MTERIKWTDCEGFTILHVDYSDLPEEAYLDTMEEAAQLLRALQGVPSDSPILVMANVINTRTTDNIADKFREVSTVMEQFKGYAHAVVGEPRALKPFARILRPGMYLTGTEQDARNWLLRQARRHTKRHPT